MDVVCGIYKITNLINGKVYIGQSIYMPKRWRNHIVTSNNPNDHAYNYPLYKAIRKYGLDNFSFEVVEGCSIDQLDEREIYWINYYDALNKEKGYNQHSGGYLPHAVKLTAQLAEEIKELLANTSISQYELARLYNVDQSYISNINRGKHWRSDNCNYPLRKDRKQKPLLEKYKEIILSRQEFYKPENYCVECGAVINKKAKRCRACEIIARKERNK